MDDLRFDSLTRALVAATRPRRQVVAAGLFGGLLAIVGLVGGEAKKNRKKRKQKIRRNSFGCVNVGGFCKNSGQCCSGVCQGKKGKKACRAHDAGTGCQAGQTEDFCGGADVTCTTATGLPAAKCFTTTGNAGFCAKGVVCRQCTRDVDCQAEFGPQAACVACLGCAEETGCASPDDII